MLKCIQNNGITDSWGSQIRGLIIWEGCMETSSHPLPNPLVCIFITDKKLTLGLSPKLALLNADWFAHVCNHNDVDVVVLMCLLINDTYLYYDDVLTIIVIYIFAYLKLCMTDLLEYFDLTNTACPRVKGWHGPCLWVPQNIITETIGFLLKLWTFNSRGWFFCLQAYF